MTKKDLIIQTDTGVMSIMLKESVLQFYDYSVEELFFKNQDIKTEQHEFQISPDFNQEIIDLGNNKYDIMMSMEISPTEEAPVPFELRVAIIGHFVYVENENATVSPDFREKILKANTAAILFPFLRQIVATLTCTANIAPLMLPIMNFSE